MVKKIFKQNLRFYSKFFLLIGALIAFICSFGVSTYAWSLDSNGNLQSDNLIDNSSSVFEMGAVSYNIGLSYSQNKVSSNARIRTINLVSVDSSLTYSLSVPSPYLVIAQGYNRGLQVSSYGTQFNQALSSLSFSGVDSVSIIVRKSDNSNFTNINDISNIDLMFNIGNVQSYEPYGTIYYSEPNMNKLVQSNYGSFAFADSISIYWNDGTYDHLYKTYSSCYEMALETWCKFINGSIQIDDYGFIFVTCGGDSDWNYVLRVHYPSGSVKISNYNIWYLYGLVRFKFLCYDNTYISQTSSITANPLVLDLTNNSYNNLNENSYISDIVFSRYTPNIALPYGRIGTPIDSNYYNDGYNDGVQDGFDDGFDEGWDEGWDEGYSIGHQEGYRDGTREDFTTNGFKTLIGSIFNYPINFIRGVFNFEFFGINIASFIMFILSIGIVIFVIRRFKK